MARRFGKFNPRQPRDSRGRWTKGKGSGSSSRFKSPARRQSRKVNANEYAQRAVGNAVGAAFAATTGRPVMAGIHAVGAAAGVYRVGSIGASRYVNRSGRFSASQRRTFNRRKAAVDKQVARIEKAQAAALAGGYIFGLAATGAGLYNMQRAGSGTTNLSRTVRALGSGGAGLKVKRPSRSGVYNITSMRR